METNNTLALQVARLRKEKGVTQEEVAKSLGVTFQAVSKWETGAALPDVALLPAIAAYFGTSVDAVLGYDAAPADDAAALYPVIKGVLERQPPEGLYRAVWNLSCLLHEAAATNCWKGHSAWPVRNRLENGGYDGWGISANVEPEGFTLLTKGFTVIGLTDQLELPAPGQARGLASLFRKLSDANVLRVLIFVIGKQKGREERVSVRLDEAAEGTGISTDECYAALDELVEHGWLEEGRNGESAFTLAGHREALLMPLLTLGGISLEL